LDILIMRMIKTLLVAVMLAPTLSWSDIAVIVNPNNPLRQISTQQVAEFYLGQTRTFSNGEYALIFDHPRDAPLRERFFAAVTGMSPQQVNAYWSRLMFTGQVQPPQPLPNERAVLDIVRRNAGAIGYIKSSEVDATVRVLLVLKE
jgi:ABC-type phosphate transport system substrate-binding protein